MGDAAGGPGWVVAVASLPSLVSGCWVVWRWMMERSDRQADSAASRGDRLSQQLEASRSALAHEQAALAQRLRDEALRCQARLQAIERDRERGWDLARYWHRRCHELHDAGVTAQSIVAGLCAREEVPVPTWPDMAVAALEEPFP